MATAKKENKNFLTYLLVGLLVVSSFLIGSLYTRVQTLQNAAKNNPTQVQGAAAAPPAKLELAKIREIYNKSLVKFGDAKNKLLLIEVADPSCPYCHIAGGLNGPLNKQAGERFTLVADGGIYIAPVPEMKKLLDAGKASFAWIYSPGHGNGEMGTKALYCAYDKGKFWQAHDLLMNAEGYDLLNKTVLNDKSKANIIVEYLKSAMDPKDMESCLNSGKYDNRLQDDIAVAGELKVQGTPGFYVNDTFFNGAYNYKDMESAVNKVLGG